MTPEHTALVARLDRLKAASLRELADDCAAAIRALAGEVERLEKLQCDFVANEYSPLLTERDTLRAEVERLTKDRDDFSKASANNWESFKRVRTEVAALRKDAERWRIARDYINVMPDGRFALALGAPEQSKTEANIDAVHLSVCAALADKPRYTDGRGNSLDHLVDEKP